MTWVHELIDAAAPDGLALIDHDGRRFNYGELRDMVGSTARQLGDLGVRPGDRVVLVAENCAAFAACVLAASLLGAWIVPVNARYSTGELRAIRDHSGARCLVFTHRASDAADAHAGTFGATATLSLPCGDMAVTKADAAATPEPVAPDPGARIAAMLYTTGTTSTPKGVMLTHANLCWNAGISAELRGLAGRDVVLGALPGSHIFGFSSTMLAAFHAGCAIQFIPRFSPSTVLAALKQGVSAFPAVPQMFERLLDHLSRTNDPFVAPRLRYISAGGAPLDPDLKARTEAAFGLSLQNGYGITETTAAVAATVPGAPRRDVSVGQPVDGVSFAIDVPDQDGVGELIIEGPGVMAGYYRDPTATALALPRAGVFRSGDLARIDTDGALHIVGRSKELIIRSGFNVYPPEIEAMLTRHPDVLQAAVVPRKTATDEEILAFVMVKGGMTGARLQDWLKARLTGYKQPQHILVVDAFPSAPTGKVLKHKLITHFAKLLDLQGTEKIENQRKGRVT